ncbi:MAG: hypothetical protein NC818_07205, partial [Candidatus Omnitrophica bacterium]|nr:hypothetical protein [Candidatus Omnitrophota bacterium]
FFLSAVLFFLKYKAKRKKISLFFFWVSLALTFLTKGPVGLLPLLVMIIYLFFEKDISLLKEIFWSKLYFLFLFLVLGLSWYLFLVFKFGFSETFSLFRYETVERFSRGYIHRASVFYFFPIVLLGFLPWTVFLPWLRVKFSSMRFLVIWFMVVFLFFSLSRSKIPTYILSLFPCLSIILAQFWESNFSRLERRFSRKIIFSMIIIFTFLIISLLCTRMFLKEKYNLAIDVFYPVFLVMVISVVALCFALRRKFFSVFLTISFLPLVSLFLFYQFFALDLGSFRSTKALLYSLKEEIKNDDTVLAYNFPKPSLVFYLQRKVFFLQDISELLFYLEKERSPLWIFIREEDYALLKNKYNFIIKSQIRNQILLKNCF